MATCKQNTGRWPGMDVLSGSRRRGGWYGAMAGDFFLAFETVV